MLILLIFLLLIALCTEIASNAATASIFVPVVLSVVSILDFLLIKRSSMAFRQKVSK